MVEISPIVKYDLENEFNYSFQQRMQRHFKRHSRGNGPKPWQSDQFNSLLQWHRLVQLL